MLTVLWFEKGSIIALKEFSDYTFLSSSLEAMHPKCTSIEIHYEGTHSYLLGRKLSTGQFVWATIQSLKEKPEPIEAIEVLYE